jgi:hypothetical protein
MAVRNSFPMELKFSSNRQNILHDYPACHCKNRGGKALLKPGPTNAAG